MQIMSCKQERIKWARHELFADSKKWRKRIRMNGPKKNQWTPAPYRNAGSIVFQYKYSNRLVSQAVCGLHEMNLKELIVVFRLLCNKPPTLPEVTQFA
jgi:hypothetical protein